MIPYLFKANKVTFDGGFIGTFDNALSCNVVESLNGAFELQMQILNNDPIVDSIEIGSIIVAKPNQTFGNQPFIIEQIVKRIDGTIDIYAPHMSQHRAKLIPVAPFTATDLADTISKISANSEEPNPFTITTDKTVSTSFVLDFPKTLRDLMGGSEGSIIDVYGGEWLYNNFDLMLMNRRGRTDSDLKVLYGSNMMEYVETDEFSWSMSYTGILPYYKDEENLVVGDIQYSDHVDEYPYKKTIVYDFTDKFEEVPTKADLETVCQTFLNGKGVPHISIDVSFEDLSTLPMYGSLNDNVNYIQLGDTVEVINSVYNTQFRSRVRTLDYDVLLERYNTIKIGDKTATINDVIGDTFPDIKQGGGGGSYIAGNGIDITDNVISSKLTAGSHINITNNAISAVFSGGKGTSISSSGVIASTLKSVAGSKVVNISGNTDGTVTLDYPSGVTSSNRLAVIFDGYVPGTTWATVLYAKQISGMTFYYRTQGSTTQNYTLRYRVLYFDD